MSSMTFTGTEAGKSSVNTEEAARGAREDGRPTEARKYIWHTEQNMGSKLWLGSLHPYTYTCKCPKMYKKNNTNIVLYSKTCFIYASF
jgi:hypothetical protein